MPLLVLENRVNMNHTAQLMNIVVVMLLVIYANVRNCALAYRVHIAINVDLAKVVGRTKYACQVGAGNIVSTPIRNAHRVRPVTLDGVFGNVKIVNIVGLMNFAVVMREVQVCVLLLVLEFRVKMIKIAHQVNIVLKRKGGMTTSVPERRPRKRVTQMMIAPLDNVVETTANVHLWHATQKRKVKASI